MSAAAHIRDCSRRPLPFCWRYGRKLLGSLGSISHLYINAILACMIDVLVYFISLLVELYWHWRDVIGVVVCFELLCAVYRQETRVMTSGMMAIVLWMELSVKNLLCLASLEGHWWGLFMTTQQQKMMNSPLKQVCVLIYCCMLFVLDAVLIYCCMLFVLDAVLMYCCVVCTWSGIDVSIQSISKFTYIAQVNWTSQMRFTVKTK